MNCDYFSLLKALAFVFPNLREIDLSTMSSDGTAYIVGDDHTPLGYFIRNCPFLEKITWNNSPRQLMIALEFDFIMDRYFMDRSNNLKEIIMDDSSFYFDNLDEMSDLIGNPTTFLFHKCGSNILERVSMRNANRYIRNTPISQNALIKFVQNSPPTMRWFRSDLTEENMSMLRNERPLIELVN